MKKPQNSLLEPASIAVLVDLGQRIQRLRLVRSFPRAAVATRAGMEFYPGNDLLLFGAIRDAAPDAWGRRVIEARFKIPANSLPESRYLLEAGANRAGALDIRTDLNSPPTSVGVHRLDYLLEAAERIESGLPIPQALDDIFQAGSGMGGMRPKASVVDAAGQLWLAKFSPLNERLNIPVVEEAALRLAGLAGLNVPETRIEMVNGKAVILIRRFDRAYPEGVEHRLHMISALTLLGCHDMMTCQDPC
jgi:serine/threonine-protein kinase HipA